MGENEKKERLLKGHGGQQGSAGGGREFLVLAKEKILIKKSQVILRKIG